MTNSSVRVVGAGVAARPDAADPGRPALPVAGRPCTTPAPARTPPDSRATRACGESPTSCATRSGSPARDCTTVTVRVIDPGLQGHRVRYLRHREPMMPFIAAQMSAEPDRLQLIELLIAMTMAVARRWAPLFAVPLAEHGLQHQPAAIRHDPERPRRARGGGARHPHHGRRRRRTTSRCWCTATTTCWRSTPTTSRRTPSTRGGRRTSMPGDARRRGDGLEHGARHRDSRHRLHLSHDQLHSSATARRRPPRRTSSISPPDARRPGPTTTSSSSASTTARRTSWRATSWRTRTASRSSNT